MSYFNEQCLQALQGIERNLGRIADMYKKTELIKLGILDPKKAFPEYKDLFEAQEKELRETWMPNYELSPEKEPTYGDIFRRFKDKYPSLANHVTDYRPAEEPNSIIIWLDITNAATGSSVIIYNNKTAAIKSAPDNSYVGVWIKKEPEPEKKEPTTDDIFWRFKDNYPILANHVTDYRPAEEPNSIIIVTDSSIIIYNDETAEIKEIKND